MNFVSAKEHYDLLIQEENDPVNDPPILQKHMDKWDGNYSRSSFKENIYQDIISTIFTIYE